MAARLFDHFLAVCLEHTNPANDSAIAFDARLLLLMYNRMLCIHTYRIPGRIHGTRVAAVTIQC